MKKVITVRFEGENPENCYDLKQWDYGVTLRIEGLSLPEKVEVHFALDNSEMAQVRLGTTEDEVTTVKIPAFILENADQIACVSGGKYKAFAYIYQSDEESGWTVRKIIFHIEARQRPEDYIHTEEDIKTWEKLEKQIGEVDKKKLTAPQTAKVGQIFRVQEVNEDGTLTLEAVDMPSGGAVDDVQIGGTSIVGEDGVAEIPKGSVSGWGLMKLLFSKCGITMDDGGIYLSRPSDEEISSRNSYKAIQPNSLDYAVKAAMTDGIGEAWTSDEQAAARARMGVGDWKEVLNYTTTLEDQNSDICYLDFESASYKEIYVIIDETGIVGDTYTSVRFGILDGSKKHGLSYCSNAAGAFSNKLKYKTYRATVFDNMVHYQATSEVQLYGYISTPYVGRMRYIDGDVYSIGGVCWLGTMYAGTKILIWGR